MRYLLEIIEELSLNLKCPLKVEDIISHKRKKSKILYLVRWKGYGPESDTWEKPSALENCPNILKKYTDKVSMGNKT